MRLWLSEDERVTQSEKGKTEKKTLYASYSLWCMENGYKTKTSTELNKSLRALGFKDSHSGSIRYFHGIEVSNTCSAFLVFSASNSLDLEPQQGHLSGEFLLLVQFLVQFGRSE